MEHENIGKNDVLRNCKIGWFTSGNWIQAQQSIQLPDGVAVLIAKPET